MITAKYSIEVISS
uniref:Uncharacterized protein n=1 Tax=Arundo donax TaxID=35708 RepID=A0A0A9EHF0_ARUDO